MDISLWKISITSALKEMWDTIAGFIPSFVGAVLIFIIGILVSKILQRVTVAIIKRLGFDRISAQVGVQESLDKAKFKSSPSELVGKLVFWIFVLIFVVIAAETLGLTTVSEAVFSLVLYLPKIIAAAAIFVIGLWLANIARNMVYRGSERLGLEYARVLSNLAYCVLALVITVLSIGQLEFEMGLLSRLVQIIFFTMGGAIMLMVGLGARDIAKNIISGIYAREWFKPGDQLIVGEDRGQIDCVGTINTILNRENGESVHIPNATLVDEIVKIKKSHSL